MNSNLLFPHVNLRSRRAVYGLTKMLYFGKVFQEKSLIGSSNYSGMFQRAVGGIRTFMALILRDKGFYILN